MKKTFFIITAMAVSLSFAHVYDFSVRMARFGTGTFTISPKPVTIRGLRYCNYLGDVSIQLKGNSCPDLTVHHLSRVIGADRDGRTYGFNCGYDFMDGGAAVYTDVNTRADCPDIILTAPGLSVVAEYYYNMEDNPYDFYQRGYTPRMPTLTALPDANYFNSIRNKTDIYRHIFSQGVR